MKVFRVSQDDPLQEVFRDASGVFYATTKLPHLQFVGQQALTMEQSGFDVRIRDANANEYRTLELHEIRALTWNGQPLFTYERAASTARPGGKEYSKETQLPRPEATFSAWTTARKPEPPWSFDRGAHVENRGAKDATREHVAETGDIHLSVPPREEVRRERAPRAVNEEP